MKIQQHVKWFRLWNILNKTQKCVFLVFDNLTIWCIHYVKFTFLALKICRNYGYEMC